MNLTPDLTERVTPQPATRGEGHRGAWAIGGVTSLVLLYFLYPSLFDLPVLLAWRTRIIPESTTMRYLLAINTPSGFLAKHFSAYEWYRALYEPRDFTGLHDQFVNYWGTGRVPEWHGSRSPRKSSHSVPRHSREE